MRYLIKRKDWYHFKRRIPKCYKHYYPNQTFIQASLKTTSEAVAVQRAEILNKELEKIWQTLDMKDPSHIDRDFQKAIYIAQSFNFSYRPVGELAHGSLEKIIHRTQTIDAAKVNKQDEIAALLGGHTKSAIKISQALRDFFAFEQPNLRRKNEDQLRKWKNPRIKAVNNFIKLCDDLPLDHIKREDILNLRSWWQERMEAEDVKPNSANKDFSHLRTLLFFAKDHYGLDIPVEEMFSRVRFKGTTSSRLPFETDFIKNELLNPKRLASLDQECCLLLYAMADLGARPSELLGLNPSKGHIRLDTEIPYIFITSEEDKEIKTVYSEREMPLVGTSLYAFQQLGNGFENYYRKPDLLSNNVNKYLRNNNLLPSENHSLYSLRHSFEDRLTAVEPPDKVQAVLMGHKYNRERYGQGPTLKQKHKWLQKIAFDVDEILRD